jgi:hypothetical protein
MPIARSPDRWDTAFFPSLSSQGQKKSPIRHIQSLSVTYGISL